MFVSVLVKKYSHTAIYKIYDVEYVTYVCMQFIKICLLDGRDDPSSLAS